MDEMNNNWIQLDKAHCWHPFTRQAEWTADDHQPLMIVRGQGSWLEDANGQRYIDGNSSIWTNVHGHAHPELNHAISAQLERVAHTSFLGFSHPLAAELAAKLTGFFTDSSLSRVFYSDDGSTAIECALKMAVQYRLQSGEPERTEFVAFADGYHGDTMGAASLGGVDAFFARFRKFGFKVHFVRSVEELRELEGLHKIAGVVIEPIVQGVNQMHVWPSGMLRELRDFTEQQGIHLILDEVMTGFGRTGKMFACQHEGVVPDFLCLAKGITGGYLPMAATLVREEIYEAFLGPAENAFYYGHSYTANPLGCAAALASLQIFEEQQIISQMQPKIAHLACSLEQLQASCAEVHQVRQCGFAIGIELRKPDGQRLDPSLRIGEKVCVAARAHGLLTRPILNTLVFMPPLCISNEEVDLALQAIRQGIREVFSH